MAQVKSNKFSAPKMTANDGRAVFINDTLTLSANPTAADTLDFFIPKGMEVSYVAYSATDMDTHGTPELSMSIGYAAIDSASTLSANATYFKADGVVGQTATGAACVFPPITFDEDVYLRFTVNTDAATFAAGTLRATIGGNMNGIR